MKKLITFLMFGLVFTGLSLWISPVEAKEPPSYETTFTNKIKDDQYLAPWVSEDKSITENIEVLLFPWAGGYWILGDIFKILALALVFIYIFYAGIHLVISWKKIEDLKKEGKNLWYIAIGAIFIWWAWRIFGPSGILEINAINWLQSIADKASDGNTSFFFQFLTLLKWWAFFFSILMIILTWIRTVMAGEADKSKKLVKGTLNVLWGLAVMKITDFIYYIASSDSFVSEASSFIITAAKFCGFLYGAIAVILVFYAGYQFITDWWKWEGMKKAKTILINMLVSWIALFAFLLILYQIFSEFS